MPIYMDRHFVEDATQTTTPDILGKHLGIHDKRDNQFLTYWFTEVPDMTFCLVKAPSKAAIHDGYHEAHESNPHKITELDTEIAETFSRRMKPWQLTILEIHIKMTGLHLKIDKEPIDRSATTVRWNSNVRYWI